METQNVMIRQMRVSDIAGAMRLKSSAGWNQTVEDWQRLLRLEPQGCFVEAQDGVIVGSTTALRYGTELAWIGMVLVLPSFRRKGIAIALMRHALAWLERSGIRVIGLDATDMGKPLYEQVGFATTDLIERWERPSESSPALGDLASARSIPELSAALQRLDRESCGFDRSELLLDFCKDSTVCGTSSSDGFAFGRPGSSAWFVGPCVARKKRSAAALLRRLLERQQGKRVFWDFLPSNQSARELATELGFRPVRQLERMMLYWGDSPALRSHPKQVFATAGFEFG